MSGGEENLFFQMINGTENAMHCNCVMQYFTVGNLLRESGSQHTKTENRED